MTSKLTNPKFCTWELWSSGRRRVGRLRLPSYPLPREGWRAAGKWQRHRNWRACVWGGVGEERPGAGGRSCRVRSKSEGKLRAKLELRLAWRTGAVHGGAPSLLGRSTARENPRAARVKAAWRSWRRLKPLNRGVVGSGKEGTSVVSEAAWLGFPFKLSARRRPPAPLQSPPEKKRLRCFGATVGEADGPLGPSALKSPLSRGAPEAIRGIRCYLSYLLQLQRWGRE